MTITLRVGEEDPPSTPQEGRAEFLEVNLPTALAAGDPITGSIKIKNIGEVSDDLRILFTTVWDSMRYAGQGTVGVGGTLTVNITEAAGLVMPSQDATVNMLAQHLQDGDWVTDAETSH